MSSTNRGIDKEKRGRARKIRASHIHAYLYILLHFHFYPINDHSLTSILNTIDGQLYEDYYSLILMSINVEWKKRSFTTLIPHDVSIFLYYKHYYRLDLEGTCATNPEIATALSEMFPSAAAAARTRKQIKECCISW